MKRTSTLPKLFKKPLFILLALFSITIANSKSYAQSRVYANTVIASGNSQSSIAGCGFLWLEPCYNNVTVNNPDNAKDATNTYARVTSSAGLLAGIGAYQGELQLVFPSAVPAGTTSYIRINNKNPDLLNALLGGNLGKLLANVVGNIILGDKYFEAGARLGQASVISGNSSNPFSTDNIKLVKDANGFFYVAITPTQSYDRVYIKDFTNALLGLGVGSYTDVYYAFHGGTVEPCAQGFATSYEGTGLTLDLLGLGKAGVTNMERAIDSDPNNFSELSLGILGVAGTMSQNIYFESPSNPTDGFNLRIKADKALLDLKLLDNISVTAYKGATQVYTTSASNLLSLDLLGLLNNGEIVSIPFTPGASFDRVKVTLSSLVNLSVTQKFNIYGVIRTAGRPTFTGAASNAVKICSGTQANLTAITASTNELRWYENLTGGTALQTVAYNGVYKTPVLTESKTYYVSARTLNCTEESGRVPVVVTVNPAITFATTPLVNATINAGYSKQINVATGGTPVFKYALAPDNSLPAGLTLSTAGVIAGTPTELVVNKTFSIIATDASNCTATASYTLTVTGPLSLATLVLPNGTVGVTYPPQTIPMVTGGTSPYTYTASNLPPGLDFDKDTHIISGTPTQAGTYVVPVKVTDANGNTISQNYTIIVRDPLALGTTQLAAGIVNTVYLTQTLPEATGGSGTYTYSVLPTDLPPGLTFDPITREIKGTPTQMDSYTFPVKVTDTDNNTISTNFTIVVRSPLVLPTKILDDGTVGATYAIQTIPSATGGTTPYTYEATNLPLGLKFDPVTRQITGIPERSGSYTVNVKVTDANQTVANQTYSIKVNGELSLPSATLPNGLVGTVYPKQTLPSVSGGTSPYTYTAVGLPAGLTFNTATRDITGTPLEGGTFTVTMTAKDVNGLTTSTDYSLLVNVGVPTVNSVAVCSGLPATLSVTSPQSGVSYRWYAATGSTSIFTGTTYKTAALTSNTVLYVEAVSGSAVSSRVQVNVTINALPNTATVTTGHEHITSGQRATLKVTADNGSTIKWYTDQTGGTSFFTGPVYTTPMLTSDKTYYVETVNATGCVSATRAKIVVTVTSAPADPSCNKASSQQSGIDGICLVCGVENPEFSTDANLNNFTKINLAVGLGATGYQTLIFGSQGAATDSIRLDLATPVGLTDLSILGKITVTVMNGTTVVGTPYLLSNTLIDLKVLGGNRFKATLAAGGVYDRVEIRFGALASVLTNLSIYGAEIIYPNPTVAATGKTICAGNVTTLTANPNGGTSLKWYSAATGGTLLASGSTFTTATPLTETTTYYIEVSKGNCANTERIPVTVTVTTAPDVPVLATTDPVCAGSVAVLAVKNPVATTTYKWYNTANSTQSVFEGPTFTTPALNNNATYFVEASNGSCTSAGRALIEAVVNPLPLVPTIAASATTVSAGQTAILEGSSSEGNVIFRWYNLANATTPIYTGPTYVTPPLTQTTTYYLEAVSNITGCVSGSRVQVTINVDNNGSANPVPCEAAITEKHGVDGIALLAGVANPQLAIDDNTKTSSSLVVPVGLIGGSVYQRVGFNGLSSLGDTVRIKLTAPGKLLSLSVLGGITLTTYNNDDSNGDRISLGSSLIHLELFSGDTEALISFVPQSVFNGVEVRLNAGLAGVLTTVDLNYAQRVTMAPKVVSADVAGCETKSAKLEVKDPIATLTYKWYNSAGVFQADGAVFNTPVLTADTKYYVAATNASNCLSYKTVVNVTVTPKPADPILVSANINICAGESVKLTISNPQPGITYIWKEGNNVLQTGVQTTYTTGIITAGVTYTVTAQNDCGGESATTTATIATGGTPTPPVVTPSDVTINKNERAILTATSSALGATFAWYKVDPTTPGATPVSTPSNGMNGSYLTDPLTTATTFWVTSTTGACTSLATSVLVNVIDLSSPESVPCEPATAQENNKGGVLSVLAGVDNELFAIDDDINTGSTLRIPVGIAAYVYQRAIFGTPSIIGDKIRIKVTSPGTLLSVGILSSLEVSTYNGGTYNNDRKVIGNPLILLQILANKKEAIIEFTPTSQFDRVELRLNSGLLGALTSINFNYAQRVIVPPVVQAVTAAACVGAQVVLTVKDPVTDGSVIYKWYQGTNPVSVGSGSTYSTDVTLTSGTYDFFVTATRNNCESVKTKVVVTILPQPVSPVEIAGNPKSICVNTTATLAVSPVTGVSFNWYDANVGGVLLAASTNSYTTPINLAVGTYEYFVEAVNGNSCASSTRTKITLTVKPKLTASDITAADKAICSGSTAVLQASSTVPGAVFKWYSKPDLTDVPFEGNNFTTPPLTVTTKFYVTISGPGICENDAASAKVVTVTVNRNATASDITASDKVICAGSKAVLTASSTTVNTPVFRWYTKPDLSDAPFVGAEYTTDFLAGTTKFYVTVSGTDACANDAASAKVVTVTVNRNATAADIIAADKNTCSGTAVILSASSTTIGAPVFSWYRDPELTDLAIRGSTFTTPQLTMTTKYYVTVSSADVCANDAANAKVVTVTVNRNGTAADITAADATICAGNSTILRASNLVIGTPVFRWYRDASLTDFAYEGANFTTPALTTDTKYYVTVSGVGVCANDAASAKVVTVNVTRNAGSSDIIADSKTICAGTSTSLTATSTIPGATFKWYRDAELTDLAFTTATITTPVLNATMRYYVTVSGTGVCTNLPGMAKVVVITVNPTPNVPIISTSGTAICSGDGTTLTIQNPQTDVTYDWYTAATNGTLVNTGTTYPILSLSGTTDFYVQATSATGCGSASGRVRVTVTVTTKPQTPSVESATVNTCLGSTATLKVSNPVTGITYNWYATAVSTTVLGSGTSFTTDPTTTSTTTYYVGAQSGTCTSTGRTAVVVNAGAIPLPPTSVGGATSPLCSGSKTTLTVNNPDGALKYAWYSGQTGGTALAEGVTFNVPALNGTTTYYVASINAITGCVSGSRTAVTVTVLPKLDAPTVFIKEAEATSITFAWNAVTGATAYEVSVDAGVTWTSPSSGPAGTTHLVAGLQPDQNVNIRVRAKGQLDCQQSDATSLNGSSKNPLGNAIFVPNTFTPNNDGKNDILYVYGNTIAKLRLRVYNQWGQFLYESLNVQNGWDGTYKGQIQPNGVYVYYLEAEFNDGTKTTKKGTITLLR